jgi:hypothetical protein
MRERAYNFSIHFRVRRTHRIVLMIVYTVTQPAENKLKLSMIRSVKFYACLSRVREQIRMTLQMPLRCIFFCLGHISAVATFS